jgi:benzoate transport
LAPLADRIGRRKTIIIGLCMVTVGMLATRWAQDVTQLVATRAFTGLGIGALFASLTTLVVEYSSEKRRTMSVSVLYLGYPIGATIGGLIAKYNIESIGWESFFLYGGIITGALIPIAIWVLPESIEFLLVRQPRNALKQINRIAGKLGLDAIDELPEPKQTSSSQNVRLLFSDSYRSQTTKLWVGFFMSLLVIYFLISWTPKVLNSAGLSLDRSILGGILLNVGGGAGMMTLGFLSSKFPLNRLIAAYFVIGAVFMAVFAASGSSLVLLMIVTTLIGFFTYGSLIGLYAFAAQRYPPNVRATGVGWAIGVGRIGSIIGPYLAGVMIGWGWDRSAYYLVLGVPLLVGAMAVYLANEHLNDTPSKPATAA